MKRRLFCILMAALLLLSLAACGASAPSEEMSMDQNLESPASREEGLTTDSSSGTGELDDSRKLVVTVNLDAETEDMDALLTWLGDRIALLKGYVESQNIQNGSIRSGYRYRYADMTIRIPAGKVDGFLKEVEGQTNIVSNSLSREDVTLNYVDTESRLTALRVEEERLLDMMEKTGTMADLLKIESRLTEVRYEIEKVTSRLRKYDDLVDYATIYLSITEVQEYTPVEVEEPTVWERIGTGFMKSIKGLWNFFVELFVFIIVASPYLVVIGGIVVLVLFIVKKKRGR